MISRPDINEAHHYAKTYIDQLVGDDLLAVFERVHNSSWRTLSDLKVSADHRYLPDKWSIKQVLQHIVDTERILSFRALCIARGESQELPAFNENDYAALSKADERGFGDIIKEFNVVRASTIELFKSFDLGMLDASGTTNGQRISARGLGWFIAGHELHHLKVIKDRYLTTSGS